MPLLMTIAALYLIWAILVHPEQVQERIIMEALKTYQMELQAGITESKITCLLPGQKEEREPGPESTERDNQEQKEAMK